MFEWVRGLSDVKILDKDSGMLFVFPTKEVRTFWMKDMNFPLDIIWITDNKIIGIEKNLQPEGSHPLRSYQSPSAVNYVLEVNAGFCEKEKIKIGDMLRYNNL